MIFKEKVLTDAALLEQLAEEASELSQAALKLSRIIRGENPTPVTEKEARDHLDEEVTDVTICIDALSEYDLFNKAKSMDIREAKVRRWNERLGKGVQHG